MSLHQGTGQRVGEGQGRGPGEAPECVRLAEALREVRSRTGLSLAALAEKTAFSKSSWERYLNGRKLPPRSAVEALCRVAREPAGRYVALWELADSAWSGRGARPTVVEPGTEPSPSPWWRRPPVPAAGVTGLVVCALAVVLTVALSLTGKPDSPPTSERAAPRQVLCHGAECTGEEPLASGCGDVEVEGAPKTLRTLRRSGVEVEIRYKPVCGAAWVRVTGQHVGDRFTISAPDVAAQHMVIADKYETGVYRSSPMVAVRAKDIRAVKACVELAGSSDLDCFQP